MKTLKLIGLMLLMANFVIAQDNNTSYSIDNDEVAGSANTIIGVEAGTSSGLGNNNVAIGYQALKSGTGINNVCIGYQTGGASNNTGQKNVFIGTQAGLRLTSGQKNVGIGESTLAFNNSGGSNLAIGNGAGYFNTTGGSNIFMGTSAGSNNTTGQSNTYIGAAAGQGQENGSVNVAIGSKAGSVATDGTSSVYSVYLGAHAGKNRPTGGQYELYIQSQPDPESNYNVPLIYGNFAQKKVGIDTDDIPAEYTLAVNGKTITEEVQVMLSEQWPDYVFAEDYNLMPLTDLEAEIETLGHLPGVPSAEEVEENGHALGKMDAILLEKVEELTLHLIDMNKEMTKLRERNEALETRLSEVEDK